jgi:hypothetical protein
MPNILYDVGVPLLWRVAASVPCVLLGFYFFSSVRHLDDFILFRVLAGVAAIVVPGVLVGPPIARFFGTYAGGLFFPDRSQAVPPAYSIARARRSQGKFHEALRCYEENLKRHPRDLQTYLDMMEISGLDLHNTVLVARIADRALAAIEDPKDRNRIELWRKRVCVVDQ